ncbi:MAG: hypothetical protein P8179_08155 [Candidatus Thiodiazotropha sp.]|jgi:hypothetical protein
MVESAALLVGEVIPEQPIRQWIAGFLEREGILERDKDACMDAGDRAKQESEPKTVT